MQRLASHMCQISAAMPATHAKHRHGPAAAPRLKRHSLSLVFFTMSGCRSDFFLLPEHYKGCTSLLVQRFGELVRLGRHMQWRCSWIPVAAGALTLICWLDVAPSAAGDKATALVANPSHLHRCTAGAQDVEPARLQGPGVAPRVHAGAAGWRTALPATLVELGSLVGADRRAGVGLAPAAAASCTCIGSPRFCCRSSLPQATSPPVCPSAPPLPQAVMSAGGKGFIIDQQSDPVDFLSWLGNTLHHDLTGGKRKKRSGALLGGGH